MNSNTIGLKVFRRWSRDNEHNSWSVEGFSLEPGVNDTLHMANVVDLLADDDNGLVVYLFSTTNECEAFRLGLMTTGEDDMMSASGMTNLGCPGVIREIEETEVYLDLLGDGEDGMIPVIDYRLRT